MADAKTLISLSLRDEASKQLRAVSGNFKKTLKEMESSDLDVDGSIGKLTSGLGGGLGGAGALLGIGGITAGVMMLGDAIGDMATKAGQLELVRTSFDSLAAGAGQSSDAMLASMRSASQGMVSDYDLILAANKAMMLGVADTGEELGALLEIARSRGAAMGLSLTQAFSDLVTGLGRESAMILDNLGITVDLQSAMNTYAKTINTTADALDGAQRKQALLNAVMAQSAGMTGGAGSAVATAAAQAEAAKANAEAAAGAFFAPAVRDFAQAQTDALDMTMGKFDELAYKAREIRDYIADLQAGFAGQGVFADAPIVDDQQSQERFLMLADLIDRINRGIAEGIPAATGYGERIAAFADKVQDMGKIDGSAWEYLKQATAGYAKVLKEVADAKGEVDAAMAETSSLHEYRNELFATAQEVTANKTAAEEAALAIGGFGRIAAAGAADVASMEAAVRGLNNAMAGMQPILSGVASMRQSAISQAESLGLQAITEGADPAQVAAMVAQVSDQIWNMGLSYDATTEAQFANKVAVAQSTEGLSAYVEGLRQTNQAASSLAAGGLKQMDQALEALRGRVGGVLSESLSLDPIGVNPADFLPRPDAVQEDAFRLADVMVNGFASPWAAYFESTFPALFSEMTQNGDIQAGAAAILQQFQAGMRPELLNFDAIKEKVKAALAMDDAIAGMRDQITAELTGAGASAAQVQGALASVLGGLGMGGAEAAPDLTTTGSGAADSFATGFTATANGGALMTKISTQMVAQVTVFDNAGRQAGTKWGVGFTAVVEQSVPPYLIDMLTRLVTPGVLAALAARDGAEGAQ